MGHILAKPNAYESFIICMLSEFIFLDAEIAACRFFLRQQGTYPAGS
jgi:hypothetical protein